MGRCVIYTGNCKDVTSNQCLVEGKKYEVVLETLYREHKTITLKGIPGEFDARLFCDDEEGIVLNSRVMKPAYFAKATLYYNDLNFYVGRTLLLKRLSDKNIFEEYWTKTPVEKIEHVYGNIYKIETMNSVYITDVNKRTVG